MSLDVVTFGEAMMMLVAEQAGPLEQAQSFIKRTAGAETNVAIGLARLGLRVGWVSRLGTDSMGRFLLAALRDEGIDCSHVVCDAGQRTGMLFKGRVAGGGDPEVEYHRRGSAASTIGPDSIDVAWLTGARHLHASGVFPALSDNCRETARRSTWSTSTSSSSGACNAAFAATSCAMARVPAWDANNTSATMDASSTIADDRNAPAIGAVTGIPVRPAGCRRSIRRVRRVRAP